MKWWWMLGGVGDRQFIDDQCTMVWACGDVWSTDWLDHHVASLGTVSKADIDSLGGVGRSDECRGGDFAFDSELLVSRGRRGVEQNVQ